MHVIDVDLRQADGEAWAMARDAEGAFLGRAGPRPSASTNW